MTERRMIETPACPTTALGSHTVASSCMQVRDPADGVFSAETMLRNMGCPLTWSLTEPLAEDGTDKRFQVGVTWVCRVNRLGFKAG